MQKSNKLKRILSILSPDGTQVDFADFDKQVSTLKDKLKEKITVKTLTDVGVQLEKLKGKLNLEPLISAVDKIQASFELELKRIAREVDDQTQWLYEEMAQKYQELEKANQSRTIELEIEISDLDGQIKKLEESSKKEIEQLTKNLPDLTDIENYIEESITQLSLRLDAIEELEIGDWQKKIDKLRIDLMNRINNIGGGSMNRKVTFGGVDYLTKYTDINYKAGTNVTFTVASNDQTKMVDVTIASTGGGGGAVRSINSISSDTTAGAAANTDYVYLVSGTTILTLPTAVANTNLYTIKNVGTGVVTVATTSAQTIDGSSNVIMPVQYTAVDLISDTANWNVT